MNRYRIQIRREMNSGFVNASQWLECAPCAAALRDIQPDAGLFRIVDERGHVVIHSEAAAPAAGKETRETLPTLSVLSVLPVLPVLLAAH